MNTNIQDESNDRKPLKSHTVIQNNKDQLSGFDHKSFNSQQVHKYKEKSINLKQQQEIEDDEEIQVQFRYKNTEGGISKEPGKDIPSSGLDLSESSPSKTLNKDYGQYDIQQKAYDFIRNHDKLRISKDDGDFMKRMLLDIFIRQTKEERLNQLVEKSKVKIEETDRLKAFNRLIEDANRRMEANDNLEALKEKLEEKLPPGKKYSEEDWKYIYYDRFKSYNDVINNKVSSKVKDKLLRDLEKEQIEVEQCKTKKAPQNVIDQTVKRLYDEAERRKLSKEVRLKERGIVEEYEERDNTPTKYKKNTNSQNYNFMVRSYLIF
jgi:hypothetical protein